MQTNSYKALYQKSLAILLCTTLFSGCLVSAFKKKNVGTKNFKVEKNTEYLNVMGNEMPAMPKFSSLSPKSGKVRGYVKDIYGNPLKGAHIGVRSSLGGGYYSGAQGETDRNGYYEFLVPQGVAHYYNAGYSIDYGDGGIAAMGLHPADGKLESFATPDGAVENFVLLSYGITSRENLSESPRLGSTYYGGSIFISYRASEDGDAHVRLEPIENPSNPLLKIAYWVSKPLFGKVLTPLKIIYSRKLPLLWFSMKIAKFEEKQNSLSPDLRLLIKTATATQNGCRFCRDIALAQAVKKKIGTEKFTALLSDDISKQTVFSDKELAMLDLLREYNEKKNVSDKTFANLRKHFNETEIIEILALNAFEHFYNALTIPLQIESDGLQQIANEKSNW